MVVKKCNIELYANKTLSGKSDHILSSSSTFAYFKFKATKKEYFTVFIDLQKIYYLYVAIGYFHEVNYADDVENH